MGGWHVGQEPLVGRRDTEEGERECDRLEQILEINARVWPLDVVHFVCAETLASWVALAVPQLPAKTCARRPNKRRLHDNSQRYLRDSVMLLVHDNRDAARNAFSHRLWAID